MKAIDIAQQNEESVTDSRTKRQWHSIVLWLVAAARGSIEAATGFGKTRIATEILKIFQRGEEKRPVIVIVPSLVLQAQWQAGLEKLGISENVEVWVINSFIKQRHPHCDLLILDEVHRYAAKTFSRVFEVVSYTFILGLTATFDRKDGKHELLRKHAPIIDRIPLREARARGWVSDYRHYNLGIEMSPEDKEEYLSYTQMFGRAMDKFERDFELMKKCSYGIEPAKRGSWYGEPYVVRYAKYMGWRGNSAARAYQLRQSGLPQKKIWEGQDVYYHPYRLYVWAQIGMRMIRKMKEFIYLHPGKLSTAIELIERMNRRTITFAQYIQTAEEIAEHFGSQAVMYHSRMEPIERRVLEEKEFKTRKGVDKFVDKNSAKGWFFKEKYGKLYAQRYVTKKISVAQLKREAIHKIINTNRTRIIATGKALDEGFDAPNIELGVTISRTSSVLQMTQRIGRAVRSHIFPDGSQKDAIFVDIYLKGTKDEQWLKTAQRGHVGIKWVDSVDEILQIEEFLGAPAGADSA